MTEPYQLIIHSGLVVDGSGNPGFHAAVGVRGDRVYVLRGDVSEVPAERRVDARGQVVAPGFIDAHSHSDLVLMVDPTLEMKVRQGVTTEILGVDGLSYAPFDDPADLVRFVRLNAGIAGHPEIDYSWRSVAELLARYDGSAAVNVGVFVGNTAPRISALGWSDAPADAVALDRMCGTVRDAMREGALGLSTGLDYPPGSYADTEELVRLAKEAARFGGIYHTHVRYALGDTYLDPFKEALEIGRKADIPVQLTHFSRSSRATYTGGAQRMLDLVEDARTEGLDVTFDTYPYEWGGTRLVRLLPGWLQADGPDPLQERLSDPALRDRIRAELMDGAAVRQYAVSRPFADVRIGNLTDPADLRFEGWNLADVVVERGGDLTEVLCGLAVANPGATFTRPSPHAMTLWKFVCHPMGMIASDSVLIGAYPSPRAYGCFARVLGDFVREERLLSLPEAIRKMTSFPAQRHGLSDRGLLRDGMKADLVVFDPATVHAPAAYERPRELALGMSYVAVNGRLVLDDGVLTGATPGRALLGPGAVR
ncbi:N-acyl-D-amino-acid deacylase family protein [Rhizohabitans arisaemae]|uniref:N-acyl-D-amino-acid deacylase family protein n=1 Tax=Rhizohabitans arisaemae TaxID=2720610 RepID=UPI0024B0E52C|nr:D-aminoacylase [Rhizohabitans arisaemae]